MRSDLDLDLDLDFDLDQAVYMLGTSSRAS